MDDTPDDATATFSTTDEKVMRDLHTLLMETSVKEGKLVCGNCGHEYRIKEGIANFLLPGHLGMLSLKILKAGGSADLIGIV